MRYEKPLHQFEFTYDTIQYQCANITTSNTLLENCDELEMKIIACMSLPKVRKMVLDVSNATIVCDRVEGSH